MLRIPCPYCGVRDETEFSFGGEARGPRPDGEVSDREWADYLFNVNNIKGNQHERWFHAFGCGQWFYATRNTVTHDIEWVCRPDEPLPDPSQ